MADEATVTPPEKPDYYADHYGIPFSVVIGFLKHSSTHEEVKEYIYQAWLLESKRRVATLKGEKA